MTIWVKLHTTWIRVADLRSGEVFTEIVTITDERMKQDDSDFSIFSAILLLIKVVIGIGLLWTAFLWLAGWFAKDGEAQMRMANRATAYSLVILFGLFVMIFVFDGKMSETWTNIIFGYPFVLIGLVFVLHMGRMVERIVKG